MAYGQTGSGKSYTMLGPHSEDEPGLPPGAHGDLGIIPRAAEELFRYLGDIGAVWGEAGREGQSAGPGLGRALRSRAAAAYPEDRALGRALWAPLLP